ncbi:hypothetical protein G7084_00130 [Weissella coleopterorum]|uniref:Uncharacterized protein n=1 Tax=Weissella coleopterorum TaxID=2714949 RepID=A0A6G8AXY2_9LACO|nr:hypothetical protein [Weissella coleopterorum]QIL49867.1 hypothetical protein G7084_00130 [Weissella coleopterorum]
MSENKSMNLSDFEIKMNILQNKVGTLEKAYLGPSTIKFRDELSNEIETLMGELVTCFVASNLGKLEKIENLNYKFKLNDDSHQYKRWVEISKDFRRFNEKPNSLGDPMMYVIYQKDYTALGLEDVRNESILIKEDSFF